MFDVYVLTEVAAALAEYGTLERGGIGGPREKPSAGSVDCMRGYFGPGAIRGLQIMTDHKKNLVINDEGPPWFVFDIEAQANIAGLFPTRYQAEDERLRLIAERRRADKDKDNGPGMPWQWRLALARLLLALILGAAAFLYAVYRTVIGDEWVGIGVMLCTLWVARALAGPLIYIDRK
ncbi:hypothetical protein [Cupriavidus sp. CP313]